MNFTAWALEEWVENYEKSVVILGVWSDCKSVSNRSTYPLFLINGRNHSGEVCCFVHGFRTITNRKEHQVNAAKVCFGGPISPGMVVVDQDAALMATVRKNMRNNLLAFDGWHLNKNQLKNATAWCWKIKRPAWKREMTMKCTKYEDQTYLGP